MGWHHGGEVSTADMIAMHTSFGDSYCSFSYRVEPPKLPLNSRMSCRQNRGPTSTRLVSTSFLFLVSTTCKHGQAEQHQHLLQPISVRQPLQDISIANLLLRSPLQDISIAHCTLAATIAGYTANKAPHNNIWAFTKFKNRPGSFGTRCDRRLSTS